MSTLYQTIGPAGTALIGVVILSIYLGLKNLIFFWLIDRGFRSFFQTVDAGKFSLDTAPEAPRNPLIAIVLEVARQHQHHSPDLRSEVAYLFHRHFHRVKGSLSTLRLITVISPLLGLLGTVLGIIKVFEVIGAASGGSVDPSTLAVGIGEALYTTVMGLVVAIPVLALFFHLRLKLSGFQIMMMEYSYRMIGATNPQCPYGNPS